MSEQIVIYGCGDCAAYRDDLDSIFQHVAPYFQGGDFSVGQCEAVLTEKGQPLPQEKLTCSTRPEFANAIKRAGFDVVNFAHNHSLGWGWESFLESIDHLHNAGLGVVGAGKNLEEARKPYYQTVKGKTIAVLGYCSVIPQDYWATNGRPGLNPLRAITHFELAEHDNPGGGGRVFTFPHPDDIQRMREDIREAKKNADIVVMSVHWGVAYTKALVADYQKIYAHVAIDEGVDVIFGHHAHVLKPIEIYKGKPIFYCLGHFASEEFWAFKRDLAVQGLKTPEEASSTERFLEMKNNSPTWKEEKHQTRSFLPDTYMAMIPKVVFDDEGIVSVSYYPTVMPPDCNSIPVKNGTEDFDKVNNFIREINEMEHMDTKLTVKGDEVFVYER